MALRRTVRRGGGSWNGGWRHGATRQKGGEYQAIRRDWFFGDKARKRELLGQLSERIRPEHHGEERPASQVEKAERVLAEEMQRRRWTVATLKKLAKGDEEKVKIAVRLRRETLVTVAWIAERLRMGSVANVNTLLYHWRQQHRHS